jgi:membrane associated rhomboid family serine protease
MITPFVTIGLIVLNVLVYFLVQPAIPNVPDMSLIPETVRGFYDQYAVVPQQIASGENYFSVLSAMFMHGGLLHLGSNMLYLWIFGDNVEHALGRAKYLAFYLVCGIAATVAQVWLFRDSTVWNLGASGAIAGVLGAYLVLFPKAQINVLVGRGWITRLSAVVVIGVWFVLQLVSGASQLLAAGEGGGVAFWAHIGGFVAGAVLAVALGGRSRGPELVGRARS